MKYFTFFFLLLIFFFFSCQKEKTGCTDSDAVNFDATAEVEDGTCKYCDPYLSPMITYAEISEDTSDYNLEVPISRNVKMELGCDLIIEIVDFCYCLEYSEITWTPAEIFDCASCAKTTLTPTESVEVRLKIDNIDGYYFSGSFDVFVPD